MEKQPYHDRKKKSLSSSLFLLTILSLTSLGVYSAYGQTQNIIELGGGQTLAPFIINDSAGVGIFNVSATGDIYITGWINLTGNTINFTNTGQMAGSMTCSDGEFLTYVASTDLWTCSTVLGASNNHYVIKQVDESVRSNAFQTDDELSILSLEVGACAGILELFVQSPSNADFKSQFRALSGLVYTGYRTNNVLNTNTGVADFTGTNENQGTNGLVQAITINFGMNVTTGGNLEIRWGQITTQDADTTVFAGSSLIMWCP